MCAADTDDLDLAEASDLVGGREIASTSSPEPPPVTSPVFMPAATQSSPVIQPPGRRASTSDSDLRRWMEEMHAAQSERCQVFESKPETSVADVSWSDRVENERLSGSPSGVRQKLESINKKWSGMFGRNSPRRNHTEKSRGPPEKKLEHPSPQKKKAALAALGSALETSVRKDSGEQDDEDISPVGKDDEYELWSAPAENLVESPVNGDGRQERQSRTGYSATASNSAELPVSSGPDVAEQQGEAMQQQVAIEEQKPESPPLPAMLSPSERYIVWADSLSQTVAMAAGDPDPSTLELIPSSFLQLLEHHITTDTSNPECPSVGQLALAFAEKHVTWWTAGIEAPSHGVYNLIAQLIRYHYPSCLGSPKASSQDSCLLLADMLERFCDGKPNKIAWSAFAPCKDSDAEVLLSFCDLLVIKDLEHLLLFVIVVLVADGLSCHTEVRDQLTAQIVAESCSSLCGEGLGKVHSIVASAIGLYEMTPESMLSGLFIADVPDPPPDPPPADVLPFCAVAAYEVLQHVFDRPSRCWRFMVVDVRRDALDTVLPMCIRIGADENRKAIVEGLPVEKCIHLCLVADSLPAIGEEAFELAKHLTGSPFFRKHVSVLTGGWRSLHSTAEAMGYALTQVEDNGKYLKRKVVDAGTSIVKNVTATQKSLSSLSAKLDRKVETAISKTFNGVVQTAKRWSLASSSDKSVEQLDDDEEKSEVKPGADEGHDDLAADEADLEVKPDADETKLVADEANPEAAEQDSEVVDA